MHNHQRILFIVNPIAGGNKKDWEEAVRGVFTNREEVIEFYHQTGENDKPAIQQCIADFAPGKVVAIGGDGTIKMVAEIVKETAIVLGIIPGGSANGLAKELGIPTDVPEAIKIILEGEEKALDAICINEKQLSFHLSDVGLNALLVKYFEASPYRGMWGYARSVLKMLWNKRKLRVTIKTDTETVKRKAYMVALANAEKYGTGAVINPNGNAFDGIFEIVVVRQLHLSEIFKAITACTAFDPKKIEVFQTKNVELVFQQKVHFQMDGEYIGKIAGIKGRILPGIVQVMVPRTNGQQAIGAGQLATEREVLV